MASVSDPNREEWHAMKRILEGPIGRRETAAMREYNEAGGAEIARALRELGLDIEDLGDLQRNGLDGTPAVPVLVEWLPRVDYPPLKLDIIFALARPWARSAIPKLIEEFLRIDPRTDAGWGSVRATISGALMFRVTAEHLPAVLEIATDASHGIHRFGFVRALGRYPKERDRVIPVLAELLADEDVRIPAIHALTRLKAVEHLPAIVEFADSSDPEVRRMVRQAIKRLGAIEPKSTEM